MARYYIMDIQSDAAFEGPRKGRAVGTILFRKDDEPPKWITMAKTQGVACFLLSDEDIVRQALEAEFDDEGPEDLPVADRIRELDGLPLSGYYDELFTEMRRGPERPVDKLIRLLVYIVQAGWDEIDVMKEKAIGHYVDEIPDEDLISDAEKAFLSSFCMEIWVGQTDHGVTASVFYFSDGELVGRIAGLAETQIPFAGLKEAFLRGKFITDPACDERSFDTAADYMEQAYALYGDGDESFQEVFAEGMAFVRRYADS